MKKKVFSINSRYGVSRLEIRKLSEEMQAHLNQMINEQSIDSGAGVLRSLIADSIELKQLKSSNKKVKKPDNKTVEPTMLEPTEVIVEKVTETTTVNNEIKTITIGLGKNKQKVLCEQTAKTYMGDATRRPEFVASMAKINVSGLSLTNAQDWYNYREILDNANEYTQPIIEEKRLALEDYERMLGKRKVALLNKLEKACIDELVYLLNEHAPNTVAKNDIPTYKKAIIERLGIQHPSLAFFRFSTRERRAMNLAYQKKTKAKQGTREFKYSMVSNYIQNAQKLLESNSYITVANGLCALTGRRPSEIFLSAEFSQTDEQSISINAEDNSDIINFAEMVRFKGQLKKKGANETDDYLIPVLCESSIVIKGLERLRMLKDLSHLNEDFTDGNGKKWTPGQRVNNLVGKSQNNAVRRDFSQFFDGNVKPYDLRHAYAFIIGKQVDPKGEKSNKLFSEILGHSEADVATCVSYMSLKTD